MLCVMAHISREQLEVASQQIAETLEQLGLGGSFEPMQRESLQALAQEITSGRDGGNISQDALVKGAEMIMEMQPKFEGLDREIMKKGIGAASKYLDVVKGKHTANVVEAAQRSKTTTHDR